MATADAPNPLNQNSTQTPERTVDRSFATFDRALEEYLAGLPKDKKHFNFIELCRASGANVTPTAINDLLQREEARRTLSGPVRRTFGIVMSALKDYSEVIGQLVSAQPLPCAIIWGALKVVVESAARCDSMFENMKDQLLSLAQHLQNITVYEDFYGDSQEMQRLFFNSYTNIIRFWHRVHKECKRKPISMVGHAMTGSALKKLGKIISDIQSGAASITEQASLCQARIANSEYADARKERSLQSDWRKKQSGVNYLDLCAQIRTHLTPPFVERANSQRHESNLRYLQTDTCQWLIQEACYTTWWGPRPEQPRLFCLSGPAGYGKSTLSSFAIRDLECKGAAVAYYFCQFSQPCDDPNEILRLLTLQLFNVYFSRRLPIDEDLAHLFLETRSPERIESLIKELVTNLLPGPGVYFFLDGLDEASPSGISPVLEFLIGLLKKYSTEKVGLWVTKRRQPRVVESFEKHIQPEHGQVLELADHTEADVVRLLQSKFGALKTRFLQEGNGEMSETDQVLFIVAEQYLIARAQGNFLWARLMTQDFDGENRVEDVKEMLTRLIGDPPKALVDLYKEHVLRFRRLNRDDQRIAVKVMSLVAFARRQLRLEELQEAAALLAAQGKGKKAASDASHLVGNMSLKNFLAKYTTLVEIDGTASQLSPSDTCRLVHSSVLEFFHQNPGTLDTDSKDRALHINRLPIANACLLYLSRPIYRRSLRKHVDDSGNYSWVDADGLSVDNHPFSQYCAKYWVRHLDDLGQKEQELLRTRAESFVASNSFQTCIQIQCIWVQGRFDVYFVGGTRSLLRAVPEWLMRKTLEGSRRSTITKYWSAYLELLHDWRKLLSCGACHDSDPDCPYLSFRGESDRVWWSAFGAGHIFSGFQGRYVSFRLCNGPATASERFEALAVTAGQIFIVRLALWDHELGFLQFVCENWEINGTDSSPTLRKTHNINTTEVDINWLLYAKPPSEGLARLVARPTSFSQDAEILRLGAQIFRRGQDNEYRAVPGGICSPYFEEASGRGTLIVIGSRSQTLAAQLQEPYRTFDRFGEDFTRLLHVANPSYQEQEAQFDNLHSDESDVEWISDTSSDVDCVEMGAYESWSEESTDDEGVILSDDSTSESDGSESSSKSPSEEEADSEFDCEEDSPSESRSTSGTQSSTSTQSVLSRSAFPDLGGSQNSDDEENFWGMAVDARLGALNHGRPLYTSEPIEGLIVLEYQDDAPPTKIFEYSCPLSSMLYDSPPAIHPQEPLVVWPLGGGKMLFADTAAKTHFTRQLRPSADLSRHISVKLQFSPCGKYLHVASLEVQVKNFEGNKAVLQSLPEIHIYVLVLTYRLSVRKPTRSPPSLLHRVKVKLGKYDGLLSVSHLPFVFTWTPSDLFVTQRASDLNVVRVQLFSTNTGPAANGSQEQAVLVSKNRIILPDSATLRDVYFTPLTGDVEGASVVIVGCETRMKSALVDEFVQLGLTDETLEERKRRALTPPVGIILQPEDLGGWIRAQDVVVPLGRSMGKLDMLREKFDPVDDCVAEPYPVSV